MSSLPRNAALADSAAQDGLEKLTSRSCRASTTFVLNLVELTLALLLSKHEPPSTRPGRRVANGRFT